jgi:hypothetical protein
MEAKEGMKAEEEEGHSTLLAVEMEEDHQTIPHHKTRQVEPVIKLELQRTGKFWKIISMRYHLLQLKTIQ